jgi:WD40 repeat protein/transcriptional regulator with XRE-family HTH domain
MSTQFSSLDSFQTFGDLLKYLRRRERLTQLELSISVGYSEAQIGRLEQNQRKPDLTAVKALFIPALHLEDEPDLTQRFLELARTARQEDAPAPGFAPYKGLLFFDQADADLFFGREALTTRLAERVTALALDASSRFLAVVGASGSGKSSLVRAGLAVALQGAGWKIHTFTPTADPLRMLASIYSASDSKKGQNHLLLVDQFEETFTHCRDENGRAEFIERLISIARDPAGKKTVVIALRADFYSHCAQYPLLRAAVAAEQEYIGQMTTEELRRAIEEPARRGGWEFEPGLVDILLSDIGADGMGQPEPGALPLLSHALLAIWERRRGRTFTLQGYHSSGGVRGAIAETAESVFTDQLNLAQQNLARDIFLRLTELGEGTEDTRRRATLSELAHQSEEAIPLRAVLNTLAEARLITLNEDTAEVAHEALIREWQRLHEWLSQDREGLLLHRHLTDAVHEWEARQRDPAELYRGARLAQTREWASANEGRLNEPERLFIAASIEQEQRDSLEREAQRQRELEAAQELAETQSRAAKQLRRRALFLAGAACLAALLGVAAGLIAVMANNNARQSTAHQLASAAEAGLGVDSGQSISLTLQSLQIQPAVDTYSLLHRALFSSHLRASVHAHDSDVVYIALSPAGDRLATTGALGRVKVWQVNGGVIDPAPLLVLEDLDAGCKDSTSTKLMFSLDGSRLAVGACDSYISLVDAHTGELIGKLTPDWGGLPGELRGLGFSPDGRWLAALGEYGQITLWDVENGQNLLTFVVNESGQGPIAITCFDFSSDGRRLATGGEDGELKLWSLEGGTDRLKATLIAQLVQKNEGPVQALRFSPDGNKLAEATLDAIHILDLAPLVSGLVGADLVNIPLNKNTVRLNSLSFTPAGDHLISTEIATLKYAADLTPYDNEIQIWDAATGFLLLNIMPEQQLMAGVISPDGQTFFTAHVGGEIHSWDISNLGSSEGLTAPAGGSGGAIYLSPDGKRLLVMNQVDLDVGKYQFSWQKVDGSRAVPLGHFTISLGERHAMLLVDKNLSRIVAVDLKNLCRVFDAADGALLKEFQLHVVGDFVLKADASRLLMHADNIFPTDSLIEVWDVPAGSRLFRFHIPDTAFYSDFSPDGNRIVTYNGNISSAQLIRWWDPATGQKIKEIDLGQAINGVVFTPDDKFWLSWGEDQTVKIYDAATDKLVRKLSPAGQITSVMVSPDNHTIAVGLSTAQTMLYSFEDGHELVTLPGSSIGFFPDRPVVLNTISGDPTVYAFDLNNTDLVKLACERLKNVTVSNSDAPEPLKICQDKSQ